MVNKKSIKERKKELQAKIIKVQERIKRDKAIIRKYRKQIEKFEEKTTGKKIMSITLLYPYDDDLHWDYPNNIHIKIGKEEFDEGTGLNYDSDDIKDLAVAFINKNVKDIGKINIKCIAYDNFGSGARSNTFEKYTIKNTTDLIKFINKIHFIDDDY